MREPVLRVVEDVGVGHSHIDTVTGSPGWIGSVLGVPVRLSHCRYCKIW